MRTALLLVIAGCGRIAIDPIADAAIAVPDAAPVACPIDGVDCDDGNICSASSTCIASTCRATGTVPASCTVARSDTEFDGMQGVRGWFYGFYNMTVDTDGVYQHTTDFETAALFPGELWRPPSWEDEPSENFTWAYLAPWGGHPGSYPERRASIRRWVSDVSGAATAVIQHDNADLGGDGTKAMLFVDGVNVFSRVLEGEDDDGFIELVPIDLKLGSTVDLFLDPNINDSVDTTTQSLQIKSR